MHQYINFIVTPVMAGLVGYATNYLAIKMLFRPFKPKWYTFGWQGIIPRTRADLAANIAKIVGEKLVTEEELDKTLRSVEVKEKVKAIIINTVSVDSEGNRVKISEAVFDLFNSYLSPSVHKVLADEEFSNYLDTLFTQWITNYVEGFCRKVKCSEIIEKIGTVGDNGNENGKFKEYIAGIVSNSVKNIVINNIDSGKSINDILAIDSEKCSHVVMNIINPVLLDIFNNPGVALELSEFLIDFKNNLDKNNINKLVSGLIKSAVTDESIRGILNVKLPEAGVFLTENEKMQEHFRDAVKTRLIYLFSTPVKDLGLKSDSCEIGEMVANTVQNSILASGIDYSSLAGMEDSTLSDFMEQGGAEVCFLLPDHIPFSKYIIANIDNFNKKLRLTLTNLESKGVDAYKISEKLSTILINMLRSFVPKFFHMVDITKLAENKINSLDLNEVEEMLLSFMKDHFKWINILGFVIGFCVGMCQAVSVTLIGRYAAG